MIDNSFFNINLLTKSVFDSIKKDGLEIYKFIFVNGTNEENLKVGSFVLVKSDNFGTNYIYKINFTKNCKRLYAKKLCIGKLSDEFLKISYKKVTFDEIIRISRNSKISKISKKIC